MFGPEFFIPAKKIGKLNDDSAFQKTRQIEGSSVMPS